MAKMPAGRMPDDNDASKIKYELFGDGAQVIDTATHV